MLGGVGSHLIGGVVHHVRLSVPRRRTRDLELTASSGQAVLFCEERRRRRSSRAGLKSNACHLLRRRPKDRRCPSPLLPSRRRRTASRGLDTDSCERLSHGHLHACVRTWPSYLRASSVHGLHEPTDIIKPPVASRSRILFESWATTASLTTRRLTRTAESGTCQVTEFLSVANAPELPGDAHKHEVQRRRMGPATT